MEGEEEKGRDVSNKRIKGFRRKEAGGEINRRQVV